MVKIVLALICTLMILGCKTRMSVHTKDTVRYEELLNFSDQIQFVIPDSLFTTTIVPKNRYLNPLSDGISGRMMFRLDFGGLNPHTRYWIRFYNKMNEFRFSLQQHNGDITTYLIGVKEFRAKEIISNQFHNRNEYEKKTMAFYITWRNHPQEPDRGEITDIGEDTYYLLTNLPNSIIKKYFPNLPCAIEHPVSNYDTLVVDWSYLIKIVPRALVDE